MLIIQPPNVLHAHFAEFKTPEEFFLGEAPAPFEWRSFDAKSYLTKVKSVPNQATPSYHSKTPELVLMAGPPASGKSSFAKTYFLSHGYEWVNRDILSTPAKCLKVRFSRHLFKSTASMCHVTLTYV